MKPALLALAATAVLGMITLLTSPGLHQATTASLGDDARLAIEVRCGDPNDGGSSTCRNQLERLYAAGALDPDRTLRAWCETRRTAPWGGTPRRVPRVCVDRYGGW